MWRMSRETNGELVLQRLQEHLLAHPENAIWTAGQQRNPITAAANPKRSDLIDIIDAATFCYVGSNRGKTCFPHAGIVPCTVTTSLMIFVADAVASLLQERKLRESAARVAMFYFWENPNQRVLFMAHPSRKKQTIAPIHRSELGFEMDPS